MAPLLELFGGEQMQKILAPLAQALLLRWAGRTPPACVVGGCDAAVSSWWQEGGRQDAGVLSGTNRDQILTWQGRSDCRFDHFFQCTLSPSSRSPAGVHTRGTRGERRSPSTRFNRGRTVSRASGAAPAPVRRAPAAKQSRAALRRAAPDRACTIASLMMSADEPWIVHWPPPAVG